MASKRTSFRVKSAFEPLLDKYKSLWGSDKKGDGNQTQAIFEALLRLDAHYRIDQRHLRELFSDEERNLMLDNALPTKYDAASIQGAVLGQTQDTEHDLFDYYRADRGVLIEKLKGLNIGQQFALVAWLEELRVKA
jgi:hypothetical protein